MTIVCTAKPLPWLIPIRIAQAIFAVIVIGLSAYVVTTPWYHSSWWNSLNFNLFIGCWTLIVALPYPILASILASGPSHRRVHYAFAPALEALTVVFWFSGFVALATQLSSVGSCHSDVCRILTAVAVFGCLEGVLFGGSLWFAASDANHERKLSKRGGAV